MDLEIFEQFAPKAPKGRKDTRNAVIYTRVSDSSQEDNTSLGTQKRTCEDFAQKKGFTIMEYFGGTHESAKTDDRKEFNNMISYVKRSKSVTYIIVYSIDRFSRSGVSGISIAEELMQKYNVVVLSASQGIDPTTASGNFQQNLLLLFSHWDNVQRRERTMTGMRDVIKDGFLPYSIPRGFVNLQKGKATNQKIVVNDEGKILKKAFHWKAEQGMKNIEIVNRLKQLGLDIDERRLGEMFRNPFYCGLIVTKYFPGQVFKGKHEAMVSKEIFLQVNNVVADSRSHPVTHKQEDENLPLKRFMKCAACETPLTGYLVRKKGLYYYKCRNSNCKCSKSANELHQHFKNILESFEIDPQDRELIKAGISAMYESYFQEQNENQSLQKAKITELKNKLERVQENRAIGDISEEIYLKFSDKYTREIKEIEIEMINNSVSSSNLENCLEWVLKFCEKPLKWWENAKIWERCILQNLMFPKGMLFDKKTGAVLTDFVNDLFAPIPQLARETLGKQKGEITNFSNFPFRVTPRGFEPPTNRTGICHSIQLNYGAVERKNTFFLAFTQDHPEKSNIFVTHSLIKHVKKIFVPFPATGFPARGTTCHGQLAHAHCQ